MFDYRNVQFIDETQYFCILFELQMGNGISSLVFLLPKTDDTIFKEGIHHDGESECFFCGKDVPRCEFFDDNDEEEVKKTLINHPAIRFLWLQHKYK